MAAGLLALPFGTAHAAETPVYDTSQAALAQSQLRDVTGRVTDRATGDPIVGVTVANNSTGSGTVTDAAGAFTVQAATGQLLTISCVGYTSWTVKVPASGAIDVELSEDAQQLDDVVVVGYATQKKINVTGAVSSISGEELAQRPVVSTMQALQGIDPSLNISIDSGNPTAGMVRHGRRPEFLTAARPEKAKPYYEALVKELEKTLPVACGVFGADMQIDACNDGPVTLFFDTAQL